MRAKTRVRTKGSRLWGNWPAIEFEIEEETKTGAETGARIGARKANDGQHHVVQSSTLVKVKIQNWKAASPTTSKRAGRTEVTTAGKRKEREGQLPTRQLRETAAVTLSGSCLFR